MDAEQCKLFLEALHCQKIRVKNNGWVEACCPLAPWTHAKKTDHTPSFGLSINPGDRSFYSCFACQSGGAEELLQTIEMYVGENKSQYDFKLCHQLLDEEPQLLPLPEYGTQPQEAQQFVEWPQYWLNSFAGVDMFTQAMEYLKNRGYDYVEIVKFNLRFDTKRQMIVSPYWDVFGRFAGARGRSVLPNVDGPSKHFDYSWQSKNNCRLVWYNEVVLNLPGAVVIVEGQFDCWKTVQAYPKVVANLTAKPSYEKMKKLGDCNQVIQIPDNDEAGKQSVEVYAKFCKQLHLTHRVLWLGEGVKDPDECAWEYLADKILEVL